MSSRAETAPRFPKFCSDVSLENHEPLLGTASRIDHWLLVEYRGLWGPDAIRSSGLSDQAKAALRAQAQARERTRLLFIRRPDRRGRSGLRAYAATSREGEESLRCCTFEAYDDLRRIDLATAGDLVDDPLFVVCTHGKHDPCCARHGRPLFEALEEQLEAETVWQSTHVGGDRFAGNVVCLPHGLYYGRVGRAAAVDLLDAHFDGRIELAHYRGRSCHTFAAQAAERDIRDANDLRAIDDLRLVGEDGGTFAFVDRSGTRHERRVVVELGPEDFLTCSATETRRPRRYVVTSP